jgi:hypothetical protein
LKFLERQAVFGSVERQPVSQGKFWIVKVNILLVAPEFNGCEFCGSSGSGHDDIF